MNRFAWILIAVLGFMLAGCGPVVEVPPAHVGKLSTSTGMKEGIIPPSKMRLDSFCRICDSLVLVEASDYAIKESMKTYIPKDSMNLDVEIRATVAISSDEKNVEKIFSRLTAKPLEGVERVSVISIGLVYVTYAQPIIREAVRSVVTKYSIQEVMENRDRINIELGQVVSERLKDTPITILQFGLADVQPPPVILAAQEATKSREIAIQKAEADKQVKLKEAEAALAVAVKQQEVDLKEAETQVLVEKKLAESVSAAFVTQRWLRVMERAMVDKNGNKFFFMPYEAMSNPAVILPALQRSMSQEVVRTAPQPVAEVKK